MRFFLLCFFGLDDDEDEDLSALLRLGIEQQFELLNLKS
jgi:hypothetical protein